MTDKIIPFAEAKAMAEMKQINLEAISHNAIATGMLEGLREIEALDYSKREVLIGTLWAVLREIPNLTQNNMHASMMNDGIEEAISIIERPEQWEQYFDREEA